MRATAEALVALGPRVSGTDRARDAANLIATRLSALGLSPTRERIGSIEKPEVAVGRWTIRPGGLGESNDENVTVRFGGDAPARLLIAHYDTVEGSPGAVDNAVSVAILLELATCFAKGSLPPGPVILAFTGAEEVGLLGARALAKKLNGNVELAISLDLLGHTEQIALNGVGSAFDRRRLGWLADRVTTARASAYVPLVHRLVSERLPQLERSDHGAFTETGVPALHLYGRGPERIFLAYHTPRDRLDQLSDVAISNALELAYEIAATHEPLPEPSRDSGFWLASPLGPFVLSSYIVLAAEIVLAIAAGLLVMLCWARRRRAIRERAVGVLGATFIFLASFLAVAIANLVATIYHASPMAAFHEPIRFTAASASLAVAVAGLLAMLVNHWAFFIRGTRYHSYASFLTLAVGVGLLAIGAIEIAWHPLAVSALFALAGFFLARPIACSLLTLSGVALSLAPLLLPSFIREALFHGFFPPWFPFAGYLALISLPSWFATVGALRARLVTPRGRLTWVLAIALVAAVGVSVAALIIPEPVCSGAAYDLFGLACELE